ncbi:MAG: DUF2163 domain-containing protein [Acetobacteraceae bacterium]
MKTLSAALKAHLAGEVTTVCTCWRITRRDGAVFRFTDHDVDLVVAGETYIAAVGYTRTAIAANADLSVDNMDVSGIFDDASITETDLRSGLFDGAEVRVFLVNWANPAQGTMALRRGRLGDVLVTPSGVFQSQLMGFSQVLQQTVGDLFTPSCRADLGDGKCGIDLDAGGWRKIATVASVTDARTFTITVEEPRAVDGWFVDGVVSFTSGANAGRSMEVKAWTQAAATVTLFLPMPAQIAIGDTLTLYPGCRKTVADCRDRFANIINFRGEPFVPGLDGLLQSPATA